MSQYEDAAIAGDEHEEFGPWGREGVPEPVMRLVSDWFVRAYDGFFVSDAWRQLDATQQRYAYAVTRSLVMMLLVDVGETPREWSRQGMEFAFDELLPHDVHQTRDYEVAFVPVCIAFLNWLADVKALPQARQLADVVKSFQPVGDERCGCQIRNEAIDVGDRVMRDSGLDPASLLDRAIYIAKYTETLCGEIDKNLTSHHEPGDAHSLVLDLLCPCGSGKKFDECCGGVN